MRRFWSFIVAPVLRARAPKHIVEIGSQSGEGSLHLLELAKEIGAHVDIVDPFAPHNFDEIRPLLHGHGTFHHGE